jgi:hypothetical protein
MAESTKELFTIISFPILVNKYNASKKTELSGLIKDQMDFGIIKEEVIQLVVHAITHQHTFSEKLHIKYMGIIETQKRVDKK